MESHEPKGLSPSDERTRNAVCVEFLASRFYSDADFTIILSDTQINEALHQAFAREANDELRDSVQEPTSRTCNTAHPWYGYCADRAGLRNSEDGPHTSFEFQETFCETEARLQVSRAFGDRAWTVSVRWDYKKGCNAHKHQPQIDPGDYVDRAKGSLRTSRWFPSCTYIPPSKPPVLFSVADIVECLNTLITTEEEKTPKHGLVLVTGRTAALKSEVARGLICKWLESAIPSSDGGRRPHLVTFEDPIEKLFLDFKNDEGAPILTLEDHERCFDYTPRQRMKDCQDLEEVLDGALRQTPTIVYVGEIREETDVAHVLEFAGTGHLVVATTHAGHLIESVSKVLTAVAANDPGRRAIYVPRILAVVHMDRLIASVPRPHEPANGADNEDTTTEFPGVVPTLYRRTTTGMQSLIADGLFSLMPNFPGDEESDVEDRSRSLARLTPAGQHGSLGRQAIAQMLCKIVASRFARSGPPELLPPEDTQRPRTDEWPGREWADVIPSWNGDRLSLLDASRRHRRGAKRIIDAALEKDLHGQ